jgi:hypothetical protein
VLTPSEKHIDVTETGIHIHDLEVVSEEVAEYLRETPEEERERTVVEAVKVGVFCLERGRAGQATEFVKRQVESLLVDVATAVGRVPATVQAELVGRIGTGDGQVLAPILRLINEVSRAIGERVTEVRMLLTDDLDPAKDSSTVGKALKSLKDLLDAGRTDSVQARIDAALGNVTGENGALAKAVKAVVAEAIAPLANEVNRLGKEFRAQEAASEALQQTTEKGLTYEEEVVGKLQAWSQPSGAAVSHVGGDKRPGDILITLPPTPLMPNQMSVVVEARDRESQPWGRKAISDLLTRAMAERKASAAVYVSRSREGLGKEIGEWAEGEGDRGPWVATVDEHLVTAVRWLIQQLQWASIRSSSPQVDTAAVDTQVKRIRTALSRLGTINRKIGDIRTNADSIQAEAEGLRDEVRGALATIEDVIRSLN